MSVSVPINVLSKLSVNCKTELQSILPKVRGMYKFEYEIGKHSFFKTGGNADVFFTPADIDDLLYFIKNKPKEIPVTIIGNMSNILVLDKGIRGVAISLKHLQHIEFCDNFARVDAGVSLGKFIQACVNKGVSCCELLYMIPGTVGGALFMNAGIPEFEIKNVVNSIGVVDITTSEISQLSNEKMSYRTGNIPEGKIITSCTLNTIPCDKKQLTDILFKIQEKRKKTQPVGVLTCGSVFKNPNKEKKAWQLIQEAGCGEKRVGGAFVSPIHSNFIINDGTATATDILTLIKEIKVQVFNRTGFLLEEEIKIIGEI